MNRIDLKALSPQPKGKTIKFRPIEERLGSVLDYTAALKRIVKIIAAALKNEVLPAYRFDALTRDELSWFQGMKAAVGFAVSGAVDTVKKVFSAESENHTKRTISDIKRSLKLDVSSTVISSDISDFMASVFARNESMTGIFAADTMADVERITMTAKARRDPLSKLKVNLLKSLKKARRRAELVARDQLSTFLSELTLERLKQMGVKLYAWSTSLDERVRARHAALEGRVYKLGEPTAAEGGGAPGTPVNCRCKPVGVIKY